MSERIGDWIQSFSGRQMWPLDPRREDFVIEDVAHSLANLNRFNGHTIVAYSVAEHTVRGSYAIVPALALPWMLHDAAEMVTGDIPRPIKRLLCVRDGAGTFKHIGDVESNILGVVFGAFGVPWPTDEEWDSIKKMDQIMLATEARDLMSPLHPDWRICEANGYSVLSEKIIPWTAEVAERLFLERYHELKGKNA